MNLRPCSLIFPHLCQHLGDPLLHPAGQLWAPEVATEQFLGDTDVPGSCLPLKTWVCGANPPQRAFRGWEEVFVSPHASLHSSLVHHAARGQQCPGPQCLATTKLFLQTEVGGGRGRASELKLQNKIKL